MSDKARQRPVRLSDQTWGAAQMAAEDEGVSTNVWISRTLEAVLGGQLVPAGEAAPGDVAADRAAETVVAVPGGPDEPAGRHGRVVGAEVPPQPLGSPGGCGHTRRARVGLSLVCADCLAPIPAMPGSAVAL